MQIRQPPRTIAPGIELGGEPIMKPPLSVKEAAAFLGTTKQQVRKLIHNGELPAVKLGREFRIPAESIEKYLVPSVSPKE